MNIFKRIMLASAVSMTLFPILAQSSVFEYSYGDPYLAPSQTYITETSNLVLSQEGVYNYWKPGVGTTTLATTTPGVITQHFDFAAMGYADPMSNISLGIFMPAFHWSYSQGYNVLYGSNDGVSWVTLAETPPVAYAGYANIGPITGLESLLGASDLWLKAELYSYGPSASHGGAMTNTAQFARYDTDLENTTFNLSVSFDDDGAGSIPEPASLVLMGLGLVGLAFRRRRI